MLNTLANPLVSPSLCNSTFSSCAMHAQTLLGSASLVASAPSILNLSQVSWTLSSPDYPSISVPGKVPSQAHIDLFDSNIIPDPYHGLNEFELRWVAYANWTYTSAPLSQLKQADDLQTWLVFNGLDTFTSIELCGQHVAATNNQFRQYYFDVSSIFSSCKMPPVLSIDFGSAPNIATKIAKQPGQETWPLGTQIPFEFSDRQFIRKEGNDFGWDWGPAFAPAGIWQPAFVVQLEKSNSLYIRNSNYDIYRLGQLNNLPPDQDQPWVFNASIDVLGSLPEDTRLAFRIVDSDSKEIILIGPLSNVTIGEGVITGSTILDPARYELWWPVGLGKQKLYDITVEVVDIKATTVSSVTKRSGFRTIVLNMGEVTEEGIAKGIAPGNHWHFEVNGHEFYAKGSNFIPPDPFWPRVTPQRIRQLFESVVAGNQNMLRVWSTGAYSPDFMYDIADEMGILLWSEFEFGDALYPVDEEFLDNCREEAIYQTRRINHHPSLALWAGGNELESLMLASLCNGAPNQCNRYRGEYEKLFLDTLLPVVYGNSKSISYTPSSTSNGYLELNFSKPIPMVERYDNKTPGHIYGDTDHYNYYAPVAFDLSTYPVGRFANEFGFHSMPSVESWQQAVDPEDLSWESRVVILRNRHYPQNSLNTTNLDNPGRGMDEMAWAVNLYYPVPNKVDPIANFSDWCHTSQIFQADYYKSQIQFYRVGSGLPNRQLGSLYWQLEDQWTAPTWAGIEYGGRWKVLHYTAKDIYSPVIITPVYNKTDSSLEIYAVSDLWSDIIGDATLTWSNYTGEVITKEPSIPFQIGAVNSTLLADIRSDDILFSNRDVFLSMNITATGKLPNYDTNTTFTHTNVFHPTPLSNVTLHDPGLKLTYSENSKTWTVEATKAPAFWVWLKNEPDTPPVIFTDNGFFLDKGEKKEVGVHSVLSEDGNENWPSNVKVRSIWDNTVE